MLSTKINLKILAGFLLIIPVVSMMFCIFNFDTPNRNEKYTHIRDGQEIPYEFSTSTVMRGKALFKKRVYYQDKDLGTVSDIQVNDLDVHPGLELGLAGNGGAVLLDTHHLQLVSKIRFIDPTGPVKIIDIPRDTTCKYLNQGDWNSPAQIIDHESNVIWSTRESSGINDADAADINHDGNLEVVVGYDNCCKVSRDDSPGNHPKCIYTVNTRRIKMVYINNDRAFEIVYATLGGELCIRNAQRRLIRNPAGKKRYNSKTKPYLYDFSLTHWPYTLGQKHIMYADDEGNGHINIMDFDGTLLKKYSAPHVSPAYYTYGTPVKLEADTPEYFAVLFNIGRWQYSVLYLYDSNGNLVYREVLKERGEAVYALHNDLKNTDTLLVGGTGKVWQYTLANQ